MAQRLCTRFVLKMSEGNVGLEAFVVKESQGTKEGLRAHLLVFVGLFLSRMPGDGKTREVYILLVSLSV